MTSAKSASQEEDERTTEVGLYHFARSYRLAADYLEQGPSRHESTHPDAPRDFLYIHAIELYLKAFLRAHGLGARELKSLRHDIPKLAQMACQRGAILDTDHARVIELLTTENVFGARYITVGAYHRPTSIGLKMAAAQLHKIVWVTLTDKGVPCAG